MFSKYSLHFPRCLILIRLIYSFLLIVVMVSSFFPSPIASTCNSSSFYSAFQFAVFRKSLLNRGFAAAFLYSLITLPVHFDLLHPTVLITFQSFLALTRLKILHLPWAGDFWKRKSLDKAIQAAIVAKLLFTIILLITIFYDLKRPFVKVLIYVPRKIIRAEK